MLLAVLQACGDPQEPVRVPVEVLAAGRALSQPVDSDLGYRVELDRAQLMIEDMVFTVAGEAHAASLLERCAGLFLSTARAHPGHFQGGDVTGELSGRRLIDWRPDHRSSLGTATLLVGEYEAADFLFARGDGSDGLGPDDALRGHTAVLSGRASRDGIEIAFEVVIDSPAERALVGVPFAVEIGEQQPRAIGFRFEPDDPSEGDTLFDGIDFELLDDDDDGRVLLGPGGADGAAADAYNRLRRAFQTHDHYRLIALTGDGP